MRVGGVAWRRWRGGGLKSLGPLPLLLLRRPLGLQQQGGGARQPPLACPWAPLCASSRRRRRRSGTFRVCRGMMLVGMTTAWGRE